MGVLRARYLLGALAVVGLALLAWLALSFFGPHKSLRPGPPPTPAAAAAPALKPSPPDLIGRASSEVADCPLTVAPAVPDAAKASREQMLAARAAFQTYDAAVNAYVKCVDAAIDRVSKEYQGAASPDELQRLSVFGNSAHNTAIDQEQAVADQFNNEIKAFKAKHPQ
jgi:hypothetical protein